MEPSSRLTTLAVTLSLVVLVGVMAWMGWMAVGGGAGEKRVQTVETMPRAPVSRPSPRPTVTRAEPAVSSASPPQSAETASAEDAALEQLQEALSAPGTIPGEVVLTFRSPTALAAFRARAGLQGLRIVDSDARLLAARVAYRDWEDLARELRGHGEDYAEAGPNFQAWIPGLPPEQPGVDAENAGGREPFREGALAAIGAVGDRSTWGRGVTVALLDSGVESHPSLEGVKVQSLAVPGSVAEAGNGHGTAMASLIAGREGPGQGVAPAVTLLDVRVADGEGGSNTALLARGILSAVDQGADVINISLGTFGDSRMLRDAVAYAEARHVVVVAAAGNEQADRLAYPAGYPGVVAVAAVDAANQQAYFSNSGQGLTVAAPGVGVVSAYADGKWVIGSGTSQATALTTGVVAVMLGRGSSPDTILRSLQNAAQPTGGQSDQVGAGLVQLPPR